MGTLKFYFSTEAVGLVYVRQESPFSITLRAGCVVNDITCSYGQAGGRSLGDCRGSGRSKNHVG